MMAKDVCSRNCLVSLARDVGFEDHNMTRSFACHAQLLEKVEVRENLSFKVFVSYD